MSTKIDLLKSFHLQLPVAWSFRVLLGEHHRDYFLSHFGGIKECQYWVISTLIVHCLGWYYNNEPLCSHCNLKPASLMGFLVVFVPARSGFIKLWKTPSCDPVLTIRGHEGRWVLVGGERCLGRVLVFLKQPNDFETAWYMISPCFLIGISGFLTVKLLTFLGFCYMFFIHNPRELTAANDVNPKNRSVTSDFGVTILL